MKRVIRVIIRMMRYWIIKMYEDQKRRKIVKERMKISRMVRRA